MKVYEGQGPILQQAGKQTKKNRSNENDFRRIMDQINSPIDRKDVIVDRKGVRPVIDGIDIVRGIEKAQAAFDVTDKEQVVGALKETLDLVDFYSSKLADSSLNARGLTPLINHLEERLAALQSMESYPDMPDKMKPVISDLEITIGTEIERFKRGDYI